MDSIFIDISSGPVINLTQYLGDGPEAIYQQAIQDALEVLNNFVQPRVIDLELAVWSEDDLGLREAEVSKDYRWSRLRQQGLPSTVALRSWAPYAEDEQQLQLSPLVVATWMSQRVFQTAKATAGRIGIADLNLVATAVRCPMQITANELDVSWEGDHLHAPLIQEHGITWALGPVEPAPLAPGVGVQFVRDAGCIFLTIALNWSLWSEESDPVQEALKDLKGLNWRVLSETT